MPANLTMPRLSDTMEVGTIVKWHAQPGQKVKSGDVIADIETDKATMELQTFEDGTIADLAVQEGQQAPVGTVILRFEGGTDAPSQKSAAVPAPAQPASAELKLAGPDKRPPRQAPSAGKPAAQDEPEPSQQPEPAQKPEPQPEAEPAQTAEAASSNGHATQERIFASPIARKIAADSGVDLAGISGTGPSGRIMRRDVEAVAATPSKSRPQPPAQPRRADDQARTTAPAAPPAGRPAPQPAPLSRDSCLKRELVTLSNMRRTIAARLVESKSTIPHYQVTVAARLDSLLDLRAQLNDQLAAQGVKLSVNDFLVRACALAMHQHPYVNSRWVSTKGQEAIELLDQVNVGVAISLPIERGGGLVVATIRQADCKGLRHISAETKTLAEKARTKGLTIEEMADSTFTISNLGMFGVEHFTAIINPPNAAILAVGAAIKKPVVETRDGQDQIVPGHEMQMTMSSDHRIVDGAMAAQYLATVKTMLEKPATLLV